MGERSWGEVIYSSLVPLFLSHLPLFPLFVWNDAHLFSVSHLSHFSLIYSLCCLSLLLHPAPTPFPLTPSLTLKWPQGKLFEVQVEFRRRPSSLSLFLPSKPTHENLPWLPLDMGSAWELKAPQNGNRNSVPCALGFVFDQMSCCVHIWHWAHLCLIEFSFAFKNGWITRRWWLSYILAPQPHELGGFCTCMS